MDHNIDLLYEELVRLTEAQHNTVDAAPRLKDPIALAAVSTISGKLKRERQQYVKDSKSNGNPKGGDGESNPLTKQYIKKQIEKTGKTYKEIKDSIECNQCGGKGHIGPDCKKKAEDKSGQSHKSKKGKSNKKGRKIA